MRKFKVLLEYEESGGYSTSVPALPGCISCGDTVEEALENTKEMIIGFIEAKRLQGRPIPKEDVKLLFAEVEIDDAELIEKPND